MGSAINPRIIRDGDNVIVDINRERQSCVKVKQHGKLKVGKAYVSVQPLIGEAFGSLFEVTGAPSRLVKRQRICEIAGEDWESAVEIDRNNSRLEDRGIANQNLTTADIELLKAEGKTGDEIVAALTQNSATFQQKTQFSQEKYRKKKSRKYTTHVTVIQPTAQSLAEFYFNKIPIKTGWLRPDSLAILLSLANISAHSRTLIVDGTGGLIAAAILDRMGAQGTLVNGYVGDKRPNTEIVSLLNLQDAARKCHIQMSLATLLDHQKHEQCSLSGEEANLAGENGLAESSPSKRPRIEEDALQGEEAAHAGQARDLLNGQASPIQNQANEALTRIPMETQEGINGPSTSTPALSNGGPALPADENQLRFAQERAERDQKVGAICRQGFQSCIIGYPTADPKALLQAVMPLLAPSASFAVFFPALQPLAECMHELIKGKSAIAMQLQESWSRQYQVLPGRTHPMMSTSGSGGYILSGIKVAQ